MELSLMRWGRHIAVFMSTTGSCRMLGSPGLVSDLERQLSFIESFSQPERFHMHKKQEYLLYPRC